MQSFHELSLPKALSINLAAMGYETPTPIQAQSIPHALVGRDVLGSAQTGTGKTAAFGIPLVAALMQDPEMTALVMTPTRELAVQVQALLKQLAGDDRTLKSALLIGGEAMPKQLNALKAKPWPRIVVGTPGRINDHIGRGTLKLKNTRFVVLDETDRMLDMGFGVQIDRVLAHVSQERQTLLFSATMPNNMADLAARYTDNPVRVSAGEANASAANIEQVQVHLQDSEKYGRLTEDLDQNTGSVLVFVKTKWNARKMAEKLEAHGYEADAIHGDLRQNKRDRVIADFRAQKVRILVATDVAARGLDIPHIEHVVNYDMPQAAEDYIHRIGRTARAGASGRALNFISPADSGKWRIISRMLASKELAPEDAGRAPHRAGNESSGYGRSNGGHAARPAPRRQFGKPAFADRADKGEERREKKSFGKPKKDFSERSESRGEERREGKPFGKSFGKPKRDFSDRPAPRGEERRDGKPFNKSFGKPKRDFADRSESRGEERRESKPFNKSFGKPKRDFSDRPAPRGDERRDGKPFGKSFGKPKRDFADRSDRPAAPRGEERRDGKPFGKSFGKPKRDFADRSDRPAPRGDERREDKPFGQSFGRKKSYVDRTVPGAEARRDGKPFGKPKRDFSDRSERPAPRGEERRDGKPAGKPFGKKPFGKSAGGGRPAGKSFGKPAGGGGNAPFRGKARP